MQIGKVHGRAGSGRRKEKQLRGGLGKGETTNRKATKLDTAEMDT